MSEKSKLKNIWIDTLVLLKKSLIKNPVHTRLKEEIYWKGTGVLMGKASHVDGRGAIKP